MEAKEKVDALRRLFMSTGWTQIIKPALDLAIKNHEMHWINGTRPDGGNNITDDVIKGRIWAFVWMKGWEDRLENLVHNLESAEIAQTPPEDSRGGGSPYS